ncbi:hypothetical protein GIHI108528_08950 [Gillisia hiemivivida]|jgi:hypothetical protein
MIKALRDSANLRFIDTSIIVPYRGKLLILAQILNTKVMER